MLAALGLLSACGGGDTEGGGGGGNGAAGSGGDRGGLQPPEDAPDRSHISFVGNLLAKVEDGEWTLGEGLVATLEAMAGERDVASILRRPELLKYDGTGILAMAYEYLEAGPDAEAKAEITRLLDLIVFSTEQLEAMAGLEPETPAPFPGQLSATTRKSSVEDCNAFFNGYDVQPGVGACLEVRTALEESHPGDFRVFRPGPSFPAAGWTNHHYDLVVQTLEDTVPAYEGLGNVKLPRISIVLSATDNPPFGGVAAPGENRPCGVVLFVGMQQQTDGDFKQLLAHEVAHCLHFETFTEQRKVPYNVSKWWDEGLADYWSNVVYPTNNLEWDVLGDLAQVELGTTLLGRTYENFLFFQHMANRAGNDGVLRLIRSLGDAKDAAGQALKLAANVGMDEAYHDFAKAMTDQKVADTGGGSIPYKIGEVNRPTILIAEPYFLQKDFKPFGVSRYRLVIDEGKEATLAFKGESVREAARPSNGSSLSWAEIPMELPEDDCDPETIIVITTVKPDSRFELEVPEVRDAPDEMPNTDMSCGLEGEWLVDNNSLEFDEEFSIVDYIKGQIRITFRTDGSAEVVYDNFEWRSHTEVFDLDVGGVLLDRYVEFTRTTNAQGATTWEIDGERITFGHVLESSYLEGTLVIHHVRTWTPSGWVEDTDEVIMREPLGIGIFGAFPKFDLRGETLRIFDAFGNVEAVLERVGPGD